MTKNRAFLGAGVKTQGRLRQNRKTMKQMLEDNIPVKLMDHDLPVGKIRKSKINYQWRSLLI
ncbi:hypothetical protein BZG78_08215 [Salinivibrio sp. MA351]|uniref:Uncharacterized protein n=1 Tax=Salinivibrio costicola subsp. alcaliphilus TaxID=272773 RepID=A0ABX3KP14_SALCS|nr:hypothetical protein BZG78_08215 [Salinivibrio sp. MA351]OOF05320.1 hypothetical protein BZG80_05895 [Salinivibrio sp. MA440]OOF05925.1 hypothetical protein BZG81_04285 [Salinivibrio sp. MA607]OOF33407.1 hypothetical protein BZJ21_10875 [Salinivibrio costicola subsp. alcaliphilus]